MRARDKSIVLRPDSSEAEIELAVRQGARRRNLNEDSAIELIDTGPIRSAARNQAVTDKRRFDTDPNYRYNATLDYLQENLSKYPGLQPKTAVVTTTPQSPASDLTIEIEKESPPLTRQGTGTAEASPVPTRATEIADLLDLPLTGTDAPVTKRATQEPASLTVDIEKRSPDAEPTPAEVKAVKARYDLRGLDPSEVDAVVGRALEARRIAATARAGNSQLIETEDGYVLIDKQTGAQVPLTSQGKIDAKRLVADERTSKLSAFSQEMSAPDYRVRGRMNESQSKALEFGSMMLQANERQKRLELKYDDPKAFADERTYVLSTLEALPADVPMNVVNQILTGGSLLAGAAKSAYETWIAQNPKASADERIRVLTSLGLGASESRALAILENRKLLSPPQREFLANVLDYSVAVLRRQSGAAVNAGEFLTTYRQYFPTAGDTQRDVLRKMRTRQQAIRGLRSSAGRPLLVPDVED